MTPDIQAVSLRSATADIVIRFVPQDKPALRSEIKLLTPVIGAQVRRVTDLGDFAGKTGETAVLYPSRAQAFRRVLLVGLGMQRSIRAESIRRAAATAMKRVRSLRAESAVVFVPATGMKRDDVVSALTEGALLASYRYDKYRTTKDEEDGPPLSRLTFALERRSHLAGARKAMTRAAIVSHATMLARDLGNAPAGEVYPETLAAAAEESAHRCGYSATILNESQIRELGMGGVLAVAQGSSRPPRFITLEYGRKEKKPVVLVGKGVCFDSGGISIKPSAGMAEMKMDMAGAAAVIGTFEAVAQLKLPVHLVGLIPAVENMPSGSAIKPGDIIRHLNGKTSEVDNTDAEGRLILADALSYAERYRPAAVIDLATLTGAVVVALGHHATGMMGTDRPLMNRLRDAGTATYERVWELPLFDEYEKLIRSDVADVKNVGGRWAGAITAGWFLRKFIGKYPWVHLDIAGTAIIEDAGEYVPKGASGVGVRLLTEFLRRWK